VPVFLAVRDGKAEFGKARNTDISVCILRRFHKISAGDLLSARGENNNMSETLKKASEGTLVFFTEKMYPELNEIIG